MKLAISNIAWDAEDDSWAYDLMERYGYSGLEIAPSRIITDAPYDKLDQIRGWKQRLHRERGFFIPSIQSIWFGRNENIFSSDEEREVLKNYMKKAILFAEAIECSNLVMGCPKNRRALGNVDAVKIAVPFFKELAEFAAMHHTVIGMEANPVIYHTNFINDTSAAVDLIKEVDSEGFRLNLDIGAMIQNKENISMIEPYVSLINHVHISEPGLAEIKKRDMHMELREILKYGHYNKYVSVEMGKGNRIEYVLEYVREIFEDEHIGK